MCIQTADVNKLICTIFNKIHTLIENENYGVECSDANVEAAAILKALSYYNFKCFSTDYIKMYLMMNPEIVYCDRHSFENVIPV